MNQKGGRSATLERWADKVEGVLKPHADGLTHAQVAKLAGISLSTTSKALCASLKRGGVIFIRRPGATLWWHYEHREIVRARHAELKAEANAKLHQARSRAEESDNAMSAFERPVVHCTVDANEAARLRPLRPRGPSSVWGLAA